MVEMDKAHLRLPKRPAHPAHRTQSAEPPACDQSRPVSFHLPESTRENCTWALLRERTVRPLAASLQLTKQATGQSGGPVSEPSANTALSVRCRDCLSVARTGISARAPANRPGPAFTAQLPGAPCREDLPRDALR